MQIKFFFAPNLFLNISLLHIRINLYFVRNHPVWSSIFFFGKSSKFGLFGEFRFDYVQTCVQKWKFSIVKYFLSHLLFVRFGVRVQFLGGSCGFKFRIENVIQSSKSSIFYWSSGGSKSEIIGFIPALKSIRFLVTCI